MELSGIHHLTAISAAIRENHRFYTQTLGMRLVKRSVNQDDVSAYHLFYADGKGSPGTDLTFFDWPVPRERRGTRSIVRSCLRVNGSEALAWWAARFDEQRVQHGDIVERDGRLTLLFEDPEGQRLALIDDGGQGDPPAEWDRSPVPRRVADSRPRAYRDQRADAQPDRRAAHACLQYAPSPRLSTSRQSRDASTRIRDGWRRATRRAACRRSA
jgi:catechol 2,3-dioxygenase-like lactoylglutathione lyase family enzyme